MRNQTQSDILARSPPLLLWLYSVYSVYMGKAAQVVGSAQVSVNVEFSVSPTISFSLLLSELDTVTLQLTRAAGFLTSHHSKLPR